MTVSEILNRFDNLGERCIQTITDEVTGEVSTSLHIRATCGYGYDDNEYAENTAIVGIIYKDSKYTKVLDKDLNKTTVKVGNAYVINIKNTNVLELHNKLCKALLKIRESNLTKQEKEVKSVEIYKEYMKKCVETLTKIGIYKYIPNKKDILAIDFIILY